jgi:UDP-N-acetylglucosamine acyltransferase
MQIHASAIVDPSANIGRNVQIGPYCIIGPEVVLGDNVELKSHVVIEGDTEIGEGTVIFPFASIGQIPQILRHNGEKGRVIIGKRNRIREYVTIQAGSADGGLLTTIGDDNLFMVGVHVAHDCIVGNHTILANYVSLAGHVEVGDFAIIGGLSAVHQFTRIGAHSMIGGVSGVVRDLIPFGTAHSDRAHLEGMNLTGMKRRGFDNKDSLAAKKAVDDLFLSEGLMADKIDKMKKEFAGNVIVEQIVEFMSKDTARHFCTPKK